MFIAAFANLGGQNSRVLGMHATDSEATDASRKKLMEIYSKNAEIISISPDWLDLVDQQHDLIHGVSPLVSPEAVQLANEILEPDSQLIVYAKRNGTSISALLPCFREDSTALWGKRRTLLSAANAYAARSGLIIRNQQFKMATELMIDILSSKMSFDVFRMNVTGKSQSEAVLKDAAERAGVTLKLDWTNQIPFIEIPSNWPQLLNSFPKKFRYTIRSSMRDLQSLGRLRLETYTQPNATSDLLDAIENVERDSWKEAARTSLTANPKQLTFHRQLCTQLATRGQLHSYVLWLDAKPIAYILGILHGNVLMDLKESFVAEHARRSPGSVLKAMVMEELAGSSVCYWDFVGKAEFHKMRWTDKTYQLNSYVAFSKTLSGRIQLAKHIVAAILGTDK